MSISQERFEELEALRTKLDVSFDMVSTLVDSWLPPPDPEEEAKEEKEELLRQKELTKSIQERHIARIGKNGIKNKAVSEMILKRKLIRKNNQKDDEDDVSSDPMRHTNKNEDLEDSKISIKKSKVNSMDNDNISKKQFGGDFLSIYLAERDKKKKRKNSKNKIS
ncbi:hypothetical protein RhiirA5_348376 [Rhizophagus irregularis]|uniref:Uncharacterized protein n=4 Tax=Rhizophagus irregularis TaxID=588596 RepID=A0A2I1DW14_9GLOM|nr:hypothetical protein GLOIN_2v1538322 [Rhizophagus irregularis DAOM 181602=DAOM 197198]EXX76141.1 hypothetical protein RirG_035790 [Rhizophagus irregularis DAOM 197198w]PKC15934.1 hypothetical protein RhiirA5_348376 [Rhizophagus irregularis]PKC74456.1 hypothetical protein RhiirA1_409107 [Rhizophagus irregularis]PKY14060.1 hypothetical protein RhiirB3_399754 [Rhizophagus irregularis]PKY39029.1 hypothetical protein RhiirA4_520807 [Rhizophagus irregularis]|eukprot:XP_025185192.1 hypothetical protein GLOIN_2v1538322 [Rhizophagus irregularis DAOM 181602=DAOM 197198]